MPQPDCPPVVFWQSNRATQFLGNKYPDDEQETENDYNEKPMNQLFHFLEDQKK